jgi:hypothetical protein
MTDEFFDRVKRAYRPARKATTISPDSMWAYIADKQKSIHDALLADHSAPLRAIFENPSRSFLFTVWIRLLQAVNAYPIPKLRRSLD